ncbi:LysR family transcriptional regulator [Anaeromyxobacter sp. PSR-1]|uniref:LysR family transcriptional regulator n=1 Tax=Anaeromyxobacter sp. PSR-1 TaxID=1300915 RepID=UPI0005E64D35|nr:LysR family transcriptional regulator [Anaeromyxobacter sp. PSR-1]GAO01557.1 HTH-type transcriptional activator NahR [Anaeromyxobacter sp. PSR-1]
MSLSALDLNLLLVLDTVLAERSVAAAARRLHVTPSAVSNALARLRAALGDPLLVRRGRGIVPTPRAAELAPVLAGALRDLGAALHGGSFDPATTTRTFTLAVADAGQLTRVPRVAALLAAEMPRARLRVVGIDSLVSLGGLSGTEIDVVIGPGEEAAGIHVEPLFEERTVLVSRAGHPATGRTLSLDALGRLCHVAVEMAPGKGFRDLAAVAYARAGVAREVAMSVPSFTAAAAVVAATDLVASIPASVLGVLGPHLGLRAVAAPVPLHAVAMKLCWHERTHADPAMAAFRDLVRRAVTSAGTTTSAGGRSAGGRSAGTATRGRARNQRSPFRS